MASKSKDEGKKHEKEIKIGEKPFSEGQGKEAKMEELCPEKGGNAKAEDFVGELNDLKKKLEEMERIVEQLKEENKLLREAAARTAADFYNYKNRIEREAEQTRRRMAASMAESLLPVLDNFDRALESQDPVDATALKKGVEMVRSQFYGVLEQFGVETIEAKGKTFDPLLHEAVAVEETSEAPDGTVLEEFQRGFLIDGKVLRASKVKVAKRSEETSEKGGNGR